jgi:Arc/MetJ family transcription regulator
MQKAINPVSIWSNGKSENANLFSMISISDNLLDTASFYYQLLASDTTVEPATETQLAQGNLTLGPDEYATWDGSNEWIMDWAAEQLNLTFVPGAELN